MCLNFDTGSARTVFPLSTGYGKRVRAKESLTFRTASGELMESQDELQVKGKDDWNQALAFKGLTAPVHKALLSAGATTDKGNDIYMYDDEAYILMAGSAIRDELRKAAAEIFARYDYAGMVPMKKERGIYNVYVTLDRDYEGQDEHLDVCPEELVSPNESDVAMGGRWQGRRP